MAEAYAYRTYAGMVTCPALRDTCSMDTGRKIASNDELCDHGGRHRLHHRPIQPAMAPCGVPAHPQDDDRSAQMVYALPCRAGSVPAAATGGIPDRAPDLGL